MNELKVAAFQMLVGGDAEANFAKISDGIERAACEGARLIAFPECALPGYPPHHLDRPDQIDTARLAELHEGVCLAARRNRVWVILGTIMPGPDGLRNSALVISDQGEIMGRYDKLHLMPDDKTFFSPGQDIPTFEIDGTLFGVLICYDARFPEPFRYLRNQGATLIVNISNACMGDTWKIPVLEGTYRTRASENSCFLAAVNAAGPLQMAVSRICGPLGLDLASANQDSEEMIFAEIDPAETESGYYYDRRTDLPFMSF